MTTKTITVDFEYDPDGYVARKIEAIKMTRMAFGIGLKEAKDLVEGGQQRLRLTPAQYGMLDALMCSSDLNGLSLLNPTVEEARPGVLDLSAHEPL